MATDQNKFLQADFSVAPDGSIKPVAKQRSHADFFDAVHEAVPDEPSKPNETNTPAPDVIQADYQVMSDGQVVETGSGSRRKGMAGTLFAIVVFLATKLKFILVGLKGVKFLSTASTALVSVGAYALFFGWQFGIGLVAMLFVHEMGHVIALRRYGVKSTAPIFIPFLGAFIGMKQLPKNAKMEAVVGLGGPVIGTVGALIAWVFYGVTGNTIFLVLAYVGMLLNLFNLVPILPLDGGRATGVLSRWFWIGGALLLVVGMFLLRSPFLMIILLFGASEVWQRFKNRKVTEENGYYTATAAERLAIGATYLGLIVVLGASMYMIGPEIINARPR